MSEFEIVAATEARLTGRPGRHHGPNKYPFCDMQPGQAFFVPNKAGDNRTRNRLSAAASKHTNRHGGKFSVRVGHRGEESGVWVIRIA